MSVFVERVLSESSDALQLLVSAHASASLLASASFSETNGGQVVITDSRGTIKFELPHHSTAQITLLSWHPLKNELVIGYETGEIDQYIDNFDNNDNNTRITTVHETTIHLGCYSGNGNNFISADENGCVVLWKRGGDARLKMLFHQELKESVSALCFLDNATNFDLNSSMRGPVGPVWSSTLALVGSSSGSVFALSSEGKITEVLPSESLQSGIRTMSLMSTFNLALVTDSMLIGHFRLERDKSGEQHLREVHRVKLSLRSRESSVVTHWMPKGHLAVGSEGYIRIYDLSTDLNLVLMANEMQGHENISCINYHQNTLAAGTNNGRLFLWTHSSDNLDDENAWTKAEEVDLGADSDSLRAVEFIKNEENERIMALLSGRRVCLVMEQRRAMSSFGDVAVIQTGPGDFAVVFFDKTSKESHVDKVSANVVITKLVMSDRLILLLSSDLVLVFELKAELRHVLKSDTFDVEAVDLACYESNIYSLDSSRRLINVHNTSGVIKQTLKLSDTEGFALNMDILGHFLSIVTSANIVKIWDLSRREARLHSHPINLRDKLGDNKAVISGFRVKLNVDASCLAFAMHGDQKLHVLDMESGLLMELDLAEEIVDIKFDENHPILFVVQTSSQNLHSLFVHEEQGLVRHDTITEQKGLTLVGISAPRIIYVDNNDDDDKEDNKMFGLRFRGLRDLDADVGSSGISSSALLGFALELCVGNAANALRHIETAAAGQPVWRNLAKMCVHSRRLDVARVCLGKMEDAVAARAIRMAVDKNNDELVVMATLALHLDMVEEAERMFGEAKRFDMLNKLYQDTLRWEEALDLSSSHDRLHLRHTHFEHALHLEQSLGDTEGSLKHLEMAGSGGLSRIPRMLFVDISALQRYVEGPRASKESRRWLAQYLESSSSINNSEDMEAALHYYEMAEDYLSVVRVLCYCDQLQKAIEVAEKTQNRAACYHLARQLENSGEIERAVNFFFKAKAYANAIRLCREQGNMDDQVWNLALMSSSSTDKLEAARHFEKGSSKPRFDRAVVLYREAGYLGKALDLAISTNQHNALQDVIKQLDEKQVVLQPNLLGRAANFFLDNNQFDKAVDLYVASNQPQSALELCLQHNVTLTEQLAEKLSTNELLGQVAEVAYRQGNYHVAAQKWTQSGDRLQAMKALLKSGDTQRIIFFANVSRQPQIYILAANYLQTLDWRANANVMRTIVNFYNKARAYRLLGLFYEACAEIEVDEYRNYEKALAALNEAHTSLARDTEAIKELQRIQRRLEFTQVFVRAQQMAHEKPEEALALSQQLLQADQEDVRRGDIFALIVEHHVKKRNFRAAYETIEQMRGDNRVDHIDYYIDPNVLREIGEAMGVQIQQQQQQQEENGYESNDES